MAITKEVKILSNRVLKLQDICATMVKAEKPKQPSIAPIICLLCLNSCLLITLIILSLRGL